MAWHYYLMSIMYIIGGMMHFIKPKVYGSIMPAYIPYKKAMVFWSGMAEVVLGLGLLFTNTKSYALWGIIVMLAVFFTVHIDMLKNKKVKAKFPIWLLWLRLPLQFGLMYWAYQYL